MTVTQWPAMSECVSWQMLFAEHIHVQQRLLFTEHKVHVQQRCWLVPGVQMQQPCNKAVRPNNAHKPPPNHVACPFTHMHMAGLSHGSYKSCKTRKPASCWHCMWLASNPRIGAGFLQTSAAGFSRPSVPFYLQKKKLNMPVVVAAAPVPVGFTSMARDPPLTPDSSVSTSPSRVALRPGTYAPVMGTTCPWML